jgi:hypothetical protein
MHKLVSKLASQQIVLYGRKCWITCKTGSDVRKQLLLSDACWVVHGHLAFWWRFQVWPGRLDQEWLYIRTKKRRALDPQLMNCYIHISFPEFKPSPVELSHILILPFSMDPVLAGMLWASNGSTQPHCGVQWIRTSSMVLPAKYWRVLGSSLESKSSTRIL